VAGGDEVACRGLSIFRIGRQISAAVGVEGGGDIMRFGVNMFNKMMIKADVVFIVGVV
jgi:hypothetical protein